MIITDRQKTNIELRQVRVGECIHWTPDKDIGRNKRLPRVFVEGSAKPVRNILWLLTGHGELPWNTMLQPTCGDRCCINPEHQQVLLQRQRKDMAREISHQSQTRKVRAAAARRAQSKLTEEQAREIRESVERGVDLARRMGITESAVSQIRTGQTWRDYGNPFTGLIP